MLKAILFDCDDVLVDTERDGHLVAFNKAFRQKGYEIEWDLNLYKDLLKISGGKERIRYYFDRFGWPKDVSDKDSFIKEIHIIKTNIFLQIVESGGLPRPGVTRLIDEAISEGIFLAVCSTANEKAVNLLIENLIGSERKNKFKVILSGDIVSKKKPDPEIYNLAIKKMNCIPNECVVIEDSRNGLVAAKAAGAYCVITKNYYTEDQNFSEADIVVSELGDPPNVKVDLEMLKNIMKK